MRLRLLPPLHYDRPSTGLLPPDSNTPGKTPYTPTELGCRPPAVEPLPLLHCGGRGEGDVSHMHAPILFYAPHAVLVNCCEHLWTQHTDTPQPMKREHTHHTTIMSVGPVQLLCHLPLLLLLLQVRQSLVRFFYPPPHHHPSTPNANATPHLPHLRQPPNKSTSLPPPHWYANPHLVGVSGPHWYDHAPPWGQLVQQQLVQLISSSTNVDGVKGCLRGQDVCGQEGWGVVCCVVVWCGV